jgi:hypothetical protein
MMTLWVSVWKLSPSSSLRVDVMMETMSETLDTNYILTWLQTVMVFLEAQIPSHYLAGEMETF